MDGTAECDGECMGDESGGMCDGECQVRAGGSCNGECKGSCELEAGGSCDGACKGECKYTPPSGECEGSAQASCEGSAEASVSCQGECKGEVEPPEVSAECEATAKAEAEFNAECTPPTVGLEYQLSAEFMAEADADATAEFEAKLEAFASVYGELLAEGARIEGILKATAGLPEAAGNAVSDAVAELSGPDIDVKLAFDLGCAGTELGAAATLITDAQADLTASVSAIAEVSGSLAGG
jgi:hypothetical protein